MSLIDSINIVQKIKVNIQKTPNKIGKTVYKKLITVINKNVLIRYFEPIRKYKK